MRRALRVAATFTVFASMIVGLVAMETRAQVDGRQAPPRETFQPLAR